VFHAAQITPQPKLLNRVVCDKTCPTKQEFKVLCSTVSQPPNQLLALIASVLPKAEQVLRSGQLEPLMSPQIIGEIIQSLSPSLPDADVILTLDSDDAAFVFELSLCLNIPFVSAKWLDLVPSDDAAFGEFLQDSNLLQIRNGQDTIAIAKGSILPESRVLVFRDVLSTGAATFGLLHLARLSGATVVGVATVIEKGYLGARSRLAMQQVEVFAAVQLARRHDQVILEKRKPHVGSAQ
jgi:adenine/guanine phosphoribosyltransferase-like PRPP-binding protein